MSPKPLPIPVKRAVRTLGEQISHWRKLRGLTQAQVAERARVSRGVVVRLEAGDGSVSLENTLRVARALGVLDLLTQAIDPFDTDMGRMRHDEMLPKRVRSRVS